MISSQILFLDIETAANETAVGNLPEPEPPANLKDPEKIRAALEKKKAEQVERAALDPDVGQIIAVALRRFPSEATNAVLVGDADVPDEAALLRVIWREIAACGGRVAGYNIIGFDLPYILRRSFALGVQAPLALRVAKYQTEPITDLMGVLYNWGPAKGLKDVAKLYGIANPLPALDGSQVADMDRETLRAYAMNDVDMTVALFEKMRGVYFPPA